MSDNNLTPSGNMPTHLDNLLLPSDNPPIPSNNNNNLKGISQKMVVHTGYGNFCINIFIIIFFLSGSITFISFFSSFYNNNEYGKLIILTLVYIFISISIFKIIQSYNTKYELIKNNFENIFKVNIFFFFCCKKKSMIFTKENLFIDILDETTTNDIFFSSTNYCLIFINTFKDKIDIDLDSSSVKNVPVQIIDILEDVRDINSIQRFLEIPNNRKNPYIAKEEDEKIGIRIFGDYKLKKNLLISDYFFTFYFEETWTNSGLTYILLFILDCLSVFGYVALVFANIARVIFILIIIFSLLLLVFLNIFGVYKKLNSIKRIDIIYSSNYDRIFIGLVKNLEKSYKNSFLFKVDSIDKFMLDPYKNSPKKEILKVIFKDKTTQDICLLNEKFYTNKLLSFLNKKCNINVN